MTKAANPATASPDSPDIVSDMEHRKLLVVPPHRYLGEAVVRIGEHPERTA